MMGMRLWSALYPNKGCTNAEEIFIATQFIRLTEMRWSVLSLIDGVSWVNLCHADTARGGLLQRTPSFQFSRTPRIQSALTHSASTMSSSPPAATPTPGHAISEPSPPKTGNDVADNMTSPPSDQDCWYTSKVPDPVTGCYTYRTCATCLNIEVREDSCSGGVLDQTLTAFLMI
jgi:hypothetical protein